MENQALTELAAKLSDISRKGYYSPYTSLEFPEHVEKNQWFTAPELISLHGTPEYERLSEEQRKVLSFWEAVNFYSLNINGERALMEGLAHRLYDRRNDEVSNYLHHFLDEENKHMVYFGTFCTKYAGKIYPDRKINFPREYEEGEEDFLFFAKVMIFEEIVDVYNKRMATDARLHPVAQKINFFHHRDEIRHLVFGRQMVKELYREFSPGWKAETREQLPQYLGNYLIATWKEYYNPDMYRDAGLENPYDIMEMAFHSDSARSHRAEISEGCLTRLKEAGIPLEEGIL